MEGRRLNKTENLPAVSLISPVFNEAQSIETLFLSAKAALDAAGIDCWEYVFIDDGSNDSSWEIISKLKEQYPAIVSAVRFRKNIGKSKALNMGFQKARGAVLITLDADLQDDPEDIPAFLRKIDEGYDVVSGWKRKRRDPPARVLASRIFNFVVSVFTGTRLHDLNCGYKAYRRDAVKSLRLYGDLHRFIPVLLDNLGYRIGEIEVHHNPRKFGKSKYGVERYLRGFSDLFTVLALTRYKFRPGHLFSSLGVLMGGGSSLVLIYLFVLWLLGDRPIGTRPLFSVAILGIIVSVQLISLGVLSELFLGYQPEHFDRDYVEEEI